MDTIPLTRNVPLPKPRIRNLYPYRDMVVGDSFFIDNGNMQNVCNNNWRQGKKLNMKFVARQEAGGIRVWRTA